MKKIFSIIITILVISSSISIVSSKSEGDIKEIDEKIKISTPTIQMGTKFTSIDFKEATSFLVDAKRPMLPVFTKVFVLPFGSEIVDVDVSFSNQKSMKLSKFVKPAPEPTPLNYLNKRSTETKLDNSVYDSSEMYPPTSFSYSTGGGVNNNEHVTFLSVKCHPIRYSPASELIYYSDEININADYNLPDTTFKTNAEYGLVIISPEKFEGLLQDLVDHKNTYDVKTFIKTTESIYSEYEGYDNPEKIKYFLKDAVEELGVGYALIVGSIDNVPIRFASIGAWGEELLPTDMYYADIYNSEGEFLNWDSNGNKKYSEWDWRDGPIDEIDLHPDINLGRIPCKNKIDVLITMNKIIDYETKNSGNSWLDRIILMGGDTFPGHGVIEGEVVTENISKQLPSFESIKLWTSTGNFGPIKINQEITKGASFVSYSGHGYKTGFGTSPPNEEDRIEYFTPYTIGMLNAKKYPVIFFDACSTAHLDFEVGGIKIPCFAWYLVKKPIGGAVATIGSTRVAYTHVDHQGIHGGAGYLNVHFFKAYKPGIFVSEMLTAAQNDYVNYVGLDALTIEEFMLIGDPSLKIGGYSNTYESKIEIKETSEGIIGQPNKALNLEAVVETSEPYTIFWDLDDDAYYNDGEGKNTELILNEPGTYQVSAKLVDSNNKISTDKAVVNILSKPDSINGPARIKKDLVTTFTINPINDPSFDKIYYLVDFGDGTYSKVFGPYSDRKQVKISNKWTNSGTYDVKVKKFAETKNGGYIESTWSDPLPVTISKIKNIELTVLEKIFKLFDERFPSLYNLLICVN